MIILDWSHSVSVFLSFALSHTKSFSFLSLSLTHTYTYSENVLILPPTPIQLRAMAPEVGKVEVRKAASKAPIRATAGPSGPGGSGGPPKFKQRNTRQFKSKPPKRGVIG